MNRLLSSSKGLVAAVMIVCVTAIVIVGAFLKQDTQLITTLAGAVAAIGWKLIDGIAREDAALKTTLPSPQSSEPQ